MYQRDEDITCEECGQPSRGFYIYEHRSHVWCYDCLLGDDTCWGLNFDKLKSITREEFIAFQVMHS
jgi:hypothetical protein